MEARMTDSNLGSFASEFPFGNLRSASFPEHLPPVPAGLHVQAEPSRFFLYSVLQSTRLEHGNLVKAPQTNNVDAFSRATFSAAALSAANFTKRSFSIFSAATFCAKTQAHK